MRSQTLQGYAPENASFWDTFHDDSCVVCPSDHWYDPKKDHVQHASCMQQKVLTHWHETMKPATNKYQESILSRITLCYKLQHGAQHFKPTNHSTKVPPAFHWICKKLPLTIVVIRSTACLEFLTCLWAPGSGFFLPLNSRIVSVFTPATDGSSKALNDDRGLRTTQSCFPIRNICLLQGGTAINLQSPNTASPVNHLEMANGNGQTCIFLPFPPQTNR